MHIRVQLLKIKVKTIIMCMEMNCQSHAVATWHSLKSLLNYFKVKITSFSSIYILSSLKQSFNTKHIYFVNV